MLNHHHKYDTNVNEMFPCFRSNNYWENEIVFYESIWNIIIFKSVQIFRDFCLPLSWLDNIELNLIKTLLYWFVLSYFVFGSTKNQIMCFESVRYSNWNHFYFPQYMALSHLKHFIVITTNCHIREMLI